jgi:hypothetical protein
VIPLNSSTSEAALMQHLLREALPLTVPYSPDTLSTISFHPVKVHGVHGCGEILLLFRSYAVSG